MRCSLHLQCTQTASHLGNWSHTYNAILFLRPPPAWIESLGDRLPLSITSLSFVELLDELPRLDEPRRAGLRLYPSSKVDRQLPAHYESNNVRGCAQLPSS